MVREEEKEIKQKESEIREWTEKDKDEMGNMVDPYYKLYVTNFIWPYLHQFFDNLHGLNGSQKLLNRPFNQYQLHLEAINNGWDIRQINR